MRFEMCCIDHQHIVCAAIGGKAREYLVEDAQTAPAYEPVIDRLVWPVNPPIRAIKRMMTTIRPIDMFAFLDFHKFFARSIPQRSFWLFKYRDNQPCAYLDRKPTLGHCLGLTRLGMYAYTYSHPAECLSKAKKEVRSQSGGGIRRSIR